MISENIIVYYRATDGLFGGHDFVLMTWQDFNEIIKQTGSN